MEKNSKERPEMSGSVRFGILGLGMGANRARLIPKTVGAELRCVCDLQEEKARMVAEELECDWTVNYDEMLARDDIDVVGVFTPSGTHCDLAIEAMESGKHAFVTKPMDIRVEKCDAAIKSAVDSGVYLAVDFGQRYSDTNQKIKMALDHGRLGKLIIGDLRMKWYRDQQYYEGGHPPGWRKRTVTEGGSAANQAIHFIDLLQWFMGPVETVYGRYGTFAHEIETEDVSIALLTFRSGAWGSLVTTTTSYPSLGSIIEMTGDNGSLVWSEGNITLYKLKNNSEPSLDEFQLDPDRPRNIIEDMVSAIQKSKPVMVNGQEGRKSVAILNAIYESSMAGKPVKPS